MISRRQLFGSLAASAAVPHLPAEARIIRVETPTPTSPEPRLPERYEEPLGIGLEGWPYPAPVRFQNCTAGGQPLRMAYMDVAPTGRDQKRTVVLLHGKNFDSSYWAGPIKDLSAAGFRVVVPDQIGFHKSSKPDVPYSLDLLAELTLNLLSGQQINEFVLIGHSFGGMLAVRIAAAYPQRVERLVLEDPLGLVDYRRYIPPQTLETLLAAERRRTVSSQRAFVRRFFTALAPEQMEPFVACRMRVAQSGEYERFCRASALTYQMIYREPVRDQFDDIAAPTLMIVGEKDQAAPLIHYAAPDMAAKMPSIPKAAPDAVKDMQKGRLVVVPGVGHVPHLEAPDLFRQEVLRFLA